jgi:predicted metal-dependent hydrolase
MSRHVLVLLDDMALRAKITALLPGCTFQFELPTGDPIAALADLYPALLIFDAARLPTWTAYSRASPATRRIPALSLATNPEQADHARSMGIPESLLITDLDPLPAGALLTRLREGVKQDALTESCEGALPALVKQGLTEFNAGAYYDAHETLEHAWKDEAGPVRDVYRAILQVAVAYYQIKRGNYDGAYKMFLRAAQWLVILPDTCHGIDLAQFKRDSQAARTHLEALGASRLSEFDPDYFGSIRWQE